MSDYKKTLHLPKTSFPMKADLARKEPDAIKRWDAINAAELMAAASGSKGGYVLHDGPPYANGHLHMGHALNKILKDIIVKSRNMAGYASRYVPGWDCHGLPIEHKVEQELSLRAGVSAREPPCERRRRRPVRTRAHHHRIRHPQRHGEHREHIRRQVDRHPAQGI